MSTVDDAIRAAVGADGAVRLAVVFGSAARGAARAGSDLDVGVMLTPGADLNALEVALSRATRRPVEVVDLRRAPPLLRFEIARDGVVVIERDPHLWSDFRAHAMLDWWDWAPTARIFANAAIKRLTGRTSHGST